MAVFGYPWKKEQTEFQNLQNVTNPKYYTGMPSCSKKNRIQNSEEERRREFRGLLGIILILDSEF
jgi:hypothetical protein